MKKFLKWVYANKYSLSGFLGIILYYVDSIFKISEKTMLPSQWYYGLVTLIFISVGIAIRGRGIECIDAYEEFEKQKRLMKKDITKKNHFLVIVEKLLSIFAKAPVDTPNQEMPMDISEEQPTDDTS